MITVLVLFALLYQKELTTAGESRGANRLGKLLNVAIAPLWIAFLLIAIFKIVEFLK